MYGNRIPKPNLALGRTCRQIRNEYLSIFKTYLREDAENIIFCVDRSELDDVIRFTKTLRPLSNGHRRQLDIRIIDQRKEIKDSESLNRWL